MANVAVKEGFHSMSASSPLPVSGLKNLGHTCGLNAIVHVLSGIPSFREAFTSAHVGRYLPSLEATRPQTEAERLERKHRIIAALVAARQSGHRSRARSSSIRLDRTVQDGGSEIINQAVEASMVENLVRVFDLMNAGNLFVDPSALYFAYLSVESEGTVAFEELDAPQVLLNLLNTLHQDLVRGMTSETTKPSSQTSLVSHFFRGATAQVIRCGNCGASQTQEHDFQGDIIVKIPTEVLPLIRRRRSDNPEMYSWEVGNLTVVDCMKNFVDGQIHEERVCAKCNKAGAVSVYNAISDLPEVLVLYLSRGEFTDGKSAKHPVFVDIDTEIDFTPFLLNSTVSSSLYDLQGVVVHHGRGTASGHFTSYVKLGPSEAEISSAPCWVHCNDTDVQLLKTINIKTALRSLPPTTSQPMLLFYVRRQGRPTPLLSAPCLLPSSSRPRKHELNTRGNAHYAPLFIDSSRASTTSSSGRHSTTVGLAHSYN